MESTKENTPRLRFKNKAERNANYTSLAQQIFQGRKILVERPPEMDRDTYRFLRKEQSLILKSLFGKGHTPNRKLQGLMGNVEPKFRTAKGYRKHITQRKTS